MTYNISGRIYKGDGTAYTSVVVRITNTTNDEYAEDTTDGSGDYSVDIQGFVSGYVNGDDITVRCNSVDKDFSVDTSRYPTGQTVNLVAYVHFKVNSTVVTKVIKVSLKKSIGQSVWVANVLLENKDGRRSQTFNAFEAVEIYIDGNTILKGRVRDIDLKTNHSLALICENESAYLFDRYLDDEQFNNKSIYYAITDGTNGIMPKYLPGLTTTNVANDANTATTFTKIFTKETVAEALEWLGNLASGIGYQFYVDNTKDLVFAEREVADSEVNLTNIGTYRNVIKWDWKESTGKDIYNRIRVYGDGFDVLRNDLTSQGTYGIREHPPITDTTLTSSANANDVGDNALSRYANPYKDASLTVKINEPIKNVGFSFKFPLNFNYTSTAKVLDIEPGDLVHVRLDGSGINDSLSEARVVESLEHQFPLYITKMNLTEYSKSLGKIIADTVRKGFK